MRAHGRTRRCNLIELREHMPECIPEYLRADYLDTGVEEQLAHGGEEDRGIDTSRTAKLTEAVGQRVADLVDGSTGFGIGGHASTLAGSMCGRHAAPVSLEEAPIRNRRQCSGRVPSRSSIMAGALATRFHLSASGFSRIGITSPALG